MTTKPTPPKTTEPVATGRRRVTLEYLESLGATVVRGSGKATTFLGVEGMVAAMRRAAAKKEPK